jgi:hypothetical protein
VEKTKLQASFTFLNQEKMAEMEKDWLGRKASDAFTFYDKRKKLIDWESSLGKDEALSSYFMKGPNPAKNAAGMLGSIFNVLGLPKKTKFTTKNSTNSESVKIPMELIYDDKTATYTQDPHKVDSFFGAAIQNAAFKSMNHGTDYFRTLQTLYDRKKEPLLNMLEAAVRYEAVDKKIGEKFPGYLKFVQRHKMDLFNNNYEGVPATASPNARLMDTIVRMLRFPSTVTEDEVKEFEKPIKKVKDNVKRRGGLPETENEIRNFTRMLYKLIIEHEEEEEPEPPGSGDGEGDENEDEGGPGSTPPGLSEEKKEEIEEELQKLAESMMESIVSSEESSMDEEEFEEFTEQMKNDPQHNYDNAGESYDCPVNFEVSRTNKSVYETESKIIDKTKAKVLATLFKRKSKDMGFTVKGMKSGRFDVSKLIEAKQGVPNVYERMGHVKTDQICVGVLIDESGSMSSRSKITKARQAAIFINEVFGKLSDVELYIYGHTADEGYGKSTTIRIYREQGVQTDPFALGSVDSRSNNRDGDAILATARRIRSKSKRSGILFVISDGQPAGDGYGGKSAIEDVRRKVIRAEKLGFQVIQIAIESSVPSHEMFKNFVKMTNINNLPGDLVRYMSRRMSTIMKEHETY